MTLKTFKPYTKSTRGTVLIDKSGAMERKTLQASYIG